MDERRKAMMATVAMPAWCGETGEENKTELIFADIYVHFSQVFICTVNKASKNPVVVKSVATF